LLFCPLEASNVCRKSGEEADDSESMHNLLLLSEGEEDGKNVCFLRLYNFQLAIKVANRSLFVKKLP
jgi:hypothetical protein